MAMKTTKTRARMMGKKPLPPVIPKATMAMSDTKPTHHEHVAMGEVDHADNAVNHRITDGDETVN